MGKLSRANLKKTFYYLKRNGLQNTWYAALERMSGRQEPAYSFIPPGKELLQEQRCKSETYREAAGNPVSFSIVVPTFRTPEQYLKEMLESVTGQTYPVWELILADVTEGDSVKNIVETYTDPRIRYVKLAENRGIAENTNQALQYATGEYVGLLDHDDVLVETALYEMLEQIEEGKKAGKAAQMLYSDEDKCNGDKTLFYEPNLKEKFNLDLLLSNNYICHFLVMKKELIQSLGFRKEYDGAQDFDLVLRAAAKLLHQESLIVHIPKVLYHWRCHTGSTAANPQSKQYAYEAGRRAVQNFADRQGWKAEAVSLKHLGFYQLHYRTSPLQERTDVGAVGGKLISRRSVMTGGNTACLKIVGGRYGEDGTLYYENLPAAFSGYLHRAVLQQDAEALDIRYIQVREECREIFAQTVGVPYVTLPGEETFDADTLPKDADIKALSLAFGKAVRKAGYRNLWLPGQVKKI